MVEIAKREALPPQTPVRVLVACQVLQVERCRLCNGFHRRGYGLIDISNTVWSSPVGTIAVIVNGLIKWKAHFRSCSCGSWRMKDGFSGVAVWIVKTSSATARQHGFTATS
jgi:hypothetical protein